MADSNVTTESIKIVVEDVASHPAEAIAKSFEKVEAAAHRAHSGASLLGASSHYLSDKWHELRSHGLGLAMTLTGVGLGFERVIEKSFEANKEFANLKKNLISTHYSLLNWKKEVSSMERLDVSKKLGSETLEKLEELRDKLAVPVPQLQAMYTKVAGPGFTKLGLSPDQVMALTTHAAESSKIYRDVSGEQIATSMTRLLEYKRLPRIGTDTFSIALRKMLADSNITDKKLLRTSSSQLYSKLMHILKGQSPVADALSHGIDDEIVRMKGTFEVLYREVGTPVFTKIAQSIKDWQQRLASCGTTMREVGTKWGTKLVEVFDKLMSLSSFIASHWKTVLLMMGANKIGGLIEKFREFGFATKSIGDIFKSGVGSGGSIFGKITGNLQLTTLALVALAVAAQEAADAINKTHEEGMARVANKPFAEGVADALGKAFRARNRLVLEPPGAPTAHGVGLRQEMESKARTARAMAGQFNALSNDRFSATSAQRTFEMLNPTEARDAARAMGVAVGAMGHVSSLDLAKRAEYMYNILNPVVKAPEVPTVEKPLSDLLKGIKPEANFNGPIYITQDFKDQDPDRVWIGFKNGMEDQAVNAVRSAGSQVFGSG